jgi:uncharacterized protein with von Willebrand factor type A (vWA) domain
MDTAEVLLGFARTLRHAGVAATPQQVQTMLAAVDALGVTEASGVYWAGRLTLCTEPDDLPTYDAAFSAYFQGAQVQRRPVRDTGRHVVVPFGVEGGPTGESGPVQAVQASDVEVLRHRELLALSAAERDELRRLLALLAPAAAPRRSRRHRPSRRGEIDPARTVRRMLRHGGEPARLARRAHRTKPRRLVLLIDVSGSMSPYADALVRFAHAAVRRRPSSTEVFTVGTRLTRVTRPLRHRDPEAALAACGQAIPDWSGGTRLGEALKAFLDRWGQRGVARRAIVVLFSDGWERGDPALLAGQMQRLSRLAHRVVWVNPHKGKAGYAPLAGGMAAALPHVDDFVTGHSFAALEQLVGVIAHA